MLMYDFCCGLKGASRAMKERGWEVVTLDNDPKFKPDIVADIRTWTPPPDDRMSQIDLAWFSPPCYEYSRESMPWCRTGETPDMSIVQGCIRVKDLINARFWILENVRGAVPYFMPLLGNPRAVFGAFYLWGFFPDIPGAGIVYRKKESYGSKEKERRAEIPYSLSLKIAEAIENTEVLL